MVLIVTILDINSISFDRKDKKFKVLIVTMLDINLLLKELSLANTSVLIVAILDINEDTTQQKLNRINSNYVRYK